MPFKPEQREYRALATPLIVPAATTESRRIESNFYVEGIAATYNTPYIIGIDKRGKEVYEMIAPGAFEGADFSDVIMQYDHTGHVYARTSNSTLIAEPVSNGLFMAADLSKSEDAKKMYTEISNGLAAKMSFAFRVLKERFDRQTNTRVIEKFAKVYDVSAVSQPANALTTIDARSLIERIVDIEPMELSVEQRRKKLLLKIKIMEVL